MEKQIQYCIDQHAKTNHYYDTYLPYEFHLRMVAQVAKENINLIEDSIDNGTSFRTDIVLAAFGHDLIEDTRTSYNDVKEVLGSRVADIVYACSNEKASDIRWDDDIDNIDITIK